MQCPSCGGELDSSTLVFDALDAYYNGKPLDLTPRERRYLKVLWDTDFVGHRTLSPCRATSAVLIMRIRRKLVKVNAPLRIRSVEGEGYCLQPIPSGEHK